MFAQGDIVKVPFLRTDDTGSKPRPSVIISNAAVNATEDVVLAQITSRQARDQFSFEITPADTDTPLANPRCQVRVHKVFIAKKSLIIKKLSHLNAAKQAELFERIKTVLQP